MTVENDRISTVGALRSHLYTLGFVLVDDLATEIGPTPTWLLELTDGDGGEPAWCEYEVEPTNGKHLLWWRIYTVAHAGDCTPPAVRCDCGGEVQMVDEEIGGFCEGCGAGHPVPLETPDWLRPAPDKKSSPAAPVSYSSYTVEPFPDQWVSITEAGRDALAELKARQVDQVELASEEQTEAAWCSHCGTITSHTREVSPDGVHTDWCCSVCVL